MIAIPPPTLQIVEVFASIQGETTFAGLPTTFIRLAACNLRCTWCDTTYSFGRGDTWEISTLIQRVESNGCSHVCISGGEPLLQANVHPLMKELCDRGWILSLETGGSLPTTEVDPRVTIILDIKCPGSGMSQKNHWANLPHLRQGDEVKFVLVDRDDYEYAKTICAKYLLFQKVRNVLFSPVHGILNPQDLVQWILEDRLPVRLNMQLHKFIWDPATQGV